MTPMFIKIITIVHDGYEEIVINIHDIKKITNIANDKVKITMIYDEEYIANSNINNVHRDLDLTILYYKNINYEDIIHTHKHLKSNSK